MRRELLTYFDDQGGDGLRPMVREAIDLNRKELTPVSSTQGKHGRSYYKRGRLSFPVARRSRHVTRPFVPRGAPDTTR